MTTAFAGAVLDADGRPFDRIRLTGLSATGHHGVLEHEKVEGQLFRADVVLHLDTREAARGDDLADTVSYAGVAEDVVAVLEGSPADLVETVAERIAATILTHPDVVAVDVAVHKPQAPITVPFEDVEVVIRRDRVVVPVVAPLARRQDAREQQPVAPIPVGSVAPALIHGVEAVRDPEPEPVLADAPAVMPPSIPPTSVVERPSEPEPFTPVPDVAAPAGSPTSGEPGAGSSDARTSAEAPTTAPTAAASEALGHDTGGVPAAGAVPASAPGVSAEPVEDTGGPVPGEQDLGAGAHEEPDPDTTHEAPAVPAAEPATHEPETVATRDESAAQGSVPEEDELGRHVPAVPAPVPAPLAGPAAAAVPDAPPLERSTTTADGTPEEPAGPAAVAERERDRMDEVPVDFVEVVLALGANLGDAQQTLRDAITDLDRISGLELTEVSPLARTAAVGPEQPDFLNAVVLARTRLSARDLLQACQAVERAHGRVRHERWGPRTLDVDLIVYGSLTAVADDLELPHPRAHERAFVLEPWSQIDPGAVLPGLGGGPVAALAATAPDRAGIRWLALDWLTEGVPNPTGAVPVATGAAASDGAASPDATAAPAQSVPPSPPLPPAPTPPAPAPPAPAPPAQGAVPAPSTPPATVAPQPAPRQEPAPRPEPAPAPEQPVPFPFDPPSHASEASPHAPAAPHAQPTQVAPFPPTMPPAHAPTSAAAPAEPLVAVPVFSPVHPDAAGHGAPAEPVWSVPPLQPVRGPAQGPAATSAQAQAPADGPAQAPARDDQLIRGVPFTPVGAPGAAPGPLADPEVHQVVRPTAAPPADPVQPVQPGTEHWSPFPPVSAPPSDAQR